MDDFDAAGFLRDCWQKQPLLIRNPWKAWVNPVSPDELAGLACEDGVESRMIVQRQDQWLVERGPVRARHFEQRRAMPWTLLVQAVDHHAPQVAALMDAFRFIPNWRIDDVMVSYATDGGGVGPHFDQYDVFLIQGLGRRRWQLGAPCDSATTCLPHDDLHLLAEFEVTAEWILEPGDILYVPPRIAHNGLAVGDDCMTYSIGFRAPSRSELIAHWCDHLLETLTDEDRFCDPDLRLQANPGEIAAEAIGSLQAMIADTLLDPQEFVRWFGQYSSQPKYPEVDWRLERPVSKARLRKGLGQGWQLRRNPASRFSFAKVKKGVLLFVDGQCFDCTEEQNSFALEICARDGIIADAHLWSSAATLDLMAKLFDQGSLAFDQDDF